MSKGDREFHFTIDVSVPVTVSRTFRAKAATPEEAEALVRASVLKNFNQIKWKILEDASDFADSPEDFEIWIECLDKIVDPKDFATVAHRHSRSKICTLPERVQVAAT